MPNGDRGKNDLSRENESLANGLAYLENKQWEHEARKEEERQCVARCARTSTNLAMCTIRLGLND